MYRRTNYTLFPGFVAAAVAATIFIYNIVEKPPETRRQASQLVRVPNSRSGGHVFESPTRQELHCRLHYALTKRG